MANLEGYIKVVAANEIGEAELYGFEVDQEERILTRLDGAIYALDGICTHEYAELVEGEVEDGCIWCPLHGSGFDLKTGAVRNLPAVEPLLTYDVQIVEGDIYVARDPRNGD